MKGYTIENSIDLLEKDVKALKEGGGGGGGASTWNQLQGKPFSSLGDELYNLDGDLTVNTISADKIALPESTEHSWDYLTQAIEALAEDSNHFSDDISELEDKTDQLFTSVSNGKTLVASAITDKGIETLATDTFSTMAENISNIPTGAEISTIDYYVVQSKSIGQNDASVYISHKQWNKTDHTTRVIATETLRYQDAGSGVDYFGVLNVKYANTNWHVKNIVKTVEYDIGTEFGTWQYNVLNNAVTIII